jgi:hypothetical protein
MMKASERKKKREGSFKRGEEEGEEGGGGEVEEGEGEEGEEEREGRGGRGERRKGMGEEGIPQGANKRKRREGKGEEVSQGTLNEAKRAKSLTKEERRDKGGRRAQRRTEGTKRGRMEAQLLDRVYFTQKKWKKLHFRILQVPTRRKGNGGFGVLYYKLHNDRVFRLVLQFFLQFFGNCIKKLVDITIGLC